MARVLEPVARDTPVGARFEAWRLLEQGLGASTGQGIAEGAFLQAATDR